MEPQFKAPYTKRFVVENSVTKVTSDGEPHETMTIVACLSGLLAAVVILAILVSLVTCKKNKNTKPCKNCSAKSSTVCSQVNSRPASMKYLISNIHNGTDSIPTTPDEVVGISYTPVLAVTSISGNLSSNLNQAFESSEFDLCNGLMPTKSAKKKSMHWSDEKSAKPLETCIVIEEPVSKY